MSVIEVYQFMCLSLFSLFGFEGGIWDLIAFTQTAHLETKIYLHLNKTAGFREFIFLS